MDNFIARNERNLRKTADASANIAKKSFIVGAAIAAPLVLAAREAVKFEDQMADVGKTTGLAGKDLRDFGNSILTLSGESRTSIEEFGKIAEIGGAMGIANNELVGFTDSVNKFNVALGKDFGDVEEATRAISKLKTLFKETRKEDVATAITKTGSAINALSAKGVRVPELTEFMSRVGQLPDAIKPSIQDVAALGATLDKAGLTAEISSRAFADLLLTGAQNLPGFAQQMKISQEAASKLLNTNPTAFAVKFAQSLKGLSAEKLANTLKAVKLTDAGAIKVVGALGSNTERLAEFQKIANAEFAKGTSLLNEYNTKNNTTAANLEKAKNNFQALSIIIGTELLPVINDLLATIVPIIKNAVAWAKENPKLVKTILYIAGAIAVLSFGVSALTGIISLVSGAMLAWEGITAAVTAVQWALNAALFANPIGLIILGIAALIAVATIVIKKYNDWGAAVTFLLGPLGLLINIIQSVRRNWDMIVEAFKTGGILAGLKAIGATLLDAILMPLQQILQIASNLPGKMGEWAQAGANNIEQFRANLGVNTTTDESGEPIKEAVNTDADQTSALTRVVENIQKQNVSINIKDQTGRAEVNNGGNFVPVKLSSTVGF